MDKMQDAILVVGPSWIGDMVMAQTLFRFLQDRQPDVVIDVLAPAAALPVVGRMPEIRQAIPLDLGHGQLQLAKRRTLGQGLRKNQYQHAIVLPNSWKSALVPFHADIPVRTGFRGEYRYFLLNDMRLLNKRTMPRMVDRFVALGAPDGSGPVDFRLPELSINTDNQQVLRRTFDLEETRPVLGICPGAEFGRAKKWPERHFAKLANQAIALGMQVWMFGGPGDRATGREIRAEVREKQFCLDFTGQTSLPDAIDLLAMCRVVVSNDSGLMHVAAAVGCTTAVLYGSTSALFTPPLTEKLEVFSLELACSPCFKRDCPLGHQDCLNKLLPEQLIPVLEKHGVGT